MFKEKTFYRLVLAFFATTTLVYAGVDTEVGGTSMRMRDEIRGFYESGTIRDFRGEFGNAGGYGDSEIHYNDLLDVGRQDDVYVPETLRDVDDSFGGQQQYDDPVNYFEIDVQELRNDGIREVTLDDGRVFSVEELEERLREKVRQQIRGQQ